MTDFYRRRPVLILSLSLYGAYCVVTLAGMLWRNVLVMPAAFVWPYPFLLAVQRVVAHPGGLVPTLAALGLGFVLIGAAAFLVERWLGPGTRLVALAPLLAVLTIALPLGGLTVLGFVVAYGFGWPMGE